MRRSRGAHALSVLVAIQVAQILASAPQQLPRFEARTDLVRLDVSVVGKDRLPILGLTAAEFAVRENGRDVPIEAVTLVRLPAGEGTSVRGLDRAPRDVATNQIGQRERLTVIVLDDAMTPGLPVFVEGAKAAARSVLAQLGPEDAASVVFTENSRAAVGLTSDFARLNEAIDRFRGGGLDVARLLGPEPAVRRAEEQRAVSSMTTLRNLAHTLSGVPGRRKTVIYISPGVPVELGSTSGDPRGPAFAVNVAYQAMLRAARESNVNIFAIESSGLDGLRQLMEQASAGLERFPEVFEERRRAVDSLSAMFTRSLQTLTSQTGGRAFTATNAFVAQAPEIFREGATYYLVAYRPSDLKPDGRFRRIEVRVNRPGVTVRARSGYYAESTTAPAVGSALAAMAGVVPGAGLPLSVTAAVLPADPADADRRALALVALQLPEGSDTAVGRWRFAVRGFTNEGAVVAALDFSASGTRSAREYVLPLRLPTGRVELRVGVQDDNGVEASVHLPVDVPNFDKASVSVSGVVIGVDIATPSTTVGDIPPGPPFLPTTRRSFRADERVRAWLQLTQTGAAEAVNLSVQIIDATASVVFDLARVVGSDEFTRGARFSQTIDVPVQTLAPGGYLVTFTATRGTERVVRQVRFEVVP